MNDPLFRTAEFPFIETEEPIECYHWIVCVKFMTTHMTTFSIPIKSPAQQYIAWIYQWKKYQREVHQVCKEVEQPTHSDEYVKGFMGAVSV